MAGADVIEPLLKELEEATEEQEEALKEEELSKREPVLETPNNGSKRIRASAAGSSSQPCQLPPPGPATHIHRLPDDVLEKIFEPLPLKTIANVVSVCHRWRAVIKDRNLIKNLKFEHGKFLAQEALSLVDSAPSLKSLELSERSDTVALLDAASAQCRNLVHLSVDSCNDSVPLTKALRKVFHKNPRITHLRLIDVHIANRLQFYRELGTVLPNLHKLKLKYLIAPLSALELDALLGSCSHNQMEEFNVCFGRWSAAEIGKLVQFWGRSLRVLKLWAFKLTDGTLAQLEGCSELRRLKLFASSTAGDWLCDLATLSHVEDLQISITREVQPENLCCFFSKSKSSQGLLKLTLHGDPGMDDSVLTSVAAFCPQLEYLDASLTEVTVSGVKEVLRCCRSLHTLLILDTDASVVNIVPELPQLAPQLRRICINCKLMNSVNAVTLRRVQAQMPHLRIG